MVVEMRSSCIMVVVSAAINYDSVLRLRYYSVVLRLRHDIVHTDLVRLLGPWSLRIPPLQGPLFEHTLRASPPDELGHFSIL